MGVFDYFYPEPPIGCARPECTGRLIDWQGYHAGNCLFRWRQGTISPFDQHASEDCKLDAIRLNAKRLPKNEKIPAVNPRCDRCDARAPFSIECITDADGCWTQTMIVGQNVSPGHVIETGWVQCASCLDAWTEVANKDVYVCPSCKKAVFLRTELIPAKPK